VALDPLPSPTPSTHPDSCVLSVPCDLTAFFQLAEREKNKHLLYKSFVFLNEFQVSNTGVGVRSSSYRMYRECGGG
jgi:hypothetical protein